MPAPLLLLHADTVETLDFQAMAAITENLVAAMPALSL
jgi:hypothetical protein